MALPLGSELELVRAKNDDREMFSKTLSLREILGQKARPATRLARRAITGLRETSSLLLVSKLSYRPVDLTDSRSADAPDCGSRGSSRTVHRQAGDRPVFDQNIDSVSF